MSGEDLGEGPREPAPHPLWVNKKEITEKKSQQGKQNNPGPQLKVWIRHCMSILKSKLDVM